MSIRSTSINLIKEKRWLPVLLVGLIAFLAAASVSVINGIPVPRVHDEFSYILAGDTFACGNLTNPTHPMWKQFETFHILQKPSYMSKYPPAQGMVLALGKVLGGHPVVGIWIGLALMCAAVTWMLQAWVPSKWALLGGLILTFHVYLGVAGYRSQSYFGGAVATFGGALLFGALRRIINEPRVASSLIFAFALLVLANSRPWEGMAASVPAVVVLIYWIITNFKTVGKKIIFRSICLPMILVLTLGAVWMGYYNYRVTGNVLKMPYKAYEQQYSVAPIFFWEEKYDTPKYNHNEIERYYTERTDDKYYTTEFVLEDAKTRIWKLWRFWGGRLLWGLYLGIPLLLALFLMKKDKWVRFSLLVIAMTTVAVSVSLPFFCHYAAPATPVIIFLIVRGLMVIKDSNLFSQRAGKVVLWAILSLFFAAFILTIVKTNIEKRESGPQFHQQRREIESSLGKDGKKHLVIVKYGKKHNINAEWVYNNADVDSSSVVWGRNMNDNASLLNYYKDRKHWLIEIDGDNESVKLLEYNKKKDNNV